MRRFLAASFGGLIAFALLAAPIPKALKKKSDEELLEGRWEIVTLDTSGAGPQAQNGDFGTFHFIYKAGVLSTGTKTSPGWKDVKMTLDPTANPKVMTLETSPGRFIKNIYEIDGDTLKWCEWQKESPPDNFTGGNGKNSFLLKRATE